MTDTPKVSIVVTYLPVDQDVEHLTEKCIASLHKYTSCPFELVRVNNSTFPYAHETRATISYALGEKTLVNNHMNLGNGKAWDQGISMAKSDTIILMDNDCWPITPGWEKEMVDRLEDPLIGMTFPNSILGDELDKLNSDMYVEFRTRRDGFCFAFKKETYDKVGPFLCDQPFKLGYYEDDWFEYRVQALGLKLVGCESSKVWHKGQGTTKRLWDERIAKGIEANKVWYEAKTGGKYPFLNKG